MLVLTVHRNEKFRAHQVHHQFQLILASMAGHMDLIHFFVHDIGSQLQQLIDHPAYQLFVSWNWRSRNNNQIVLRHLHLPVIAARHAGQG